MTPAYSGIANGDWVVEDAASRPDDDTNDTRRVIGRLKVCEGVDGVCVTSSGAMCLLVIRRGVRIFALVHLAVTSKVGYN
jgi:hypothetical protein